ncbi:hypothetical protein JWZ98_17050 [Methylomonas sp. EFPC1]|uniref:hypothetical protein n=1 Tax=Methylomonas sp. EFPC1 TaxID=2812647 RepID=UPI0019689508|nr:hypothetical protein [Methylomonas sp. EFPC1]QSB00373.1 hypothetical protein JWZ98_17050 [Methylomonas sp. EFPC1]
MLLDHQDEYPSEWAAIQSISAESGCAAETLRRWLRLSQTAGVKPKGPVDSQSEQTKALECEVR